MEGCPECFRVLTLNLKLQRAKIKSCSKGMREDLGWWLAWCILQEVGREKIRFQREGLVWHVGGVEPFVLLN